MPRGRIAREPVAEDAARLGDRGPGTRIAALHARAPGIAAQGEFRGLLLRVGTEHEHAEDQLRLGLMRGGLEALAIQASDDRGLLGCDEVREGETRTEVGGELRLWSVEPSSQSAGG